MLNVKTYLFSAITFIVGAFVALAVLRWIDYNHPALALMLGTIMALGVVAWHVASRGNIWTPSVGEKLRLGLFLGCIGLLVGLCMHFLIQPFDHPVVTLGVGVIGICVFPFVMLSQFVASWNKQLESKSNTSNKS